MTTSPTRVKQSSDVAKSLTDLADSIRGDVTSTYPYGVVDSLTSAICIVAQSLAPPSEGSSVADALYDCSRAIERQAEAMDNLGATIRSGFSELAEAVLAGKEASQ